MSTTPSNNRPAHKIRVGRITGTILKNDTERGPMYNVTFTRSYQDETKTWRDTQSFGLSDLLVVAKIALDAHTWITQGRGSPERGDGEKSKGSNRRQAAHA